MFIPPCICLLRIQTFASVQGLRHRFVVGCPNEAKYLHHSGLGICTRVFHVPFRKRVIGSASSKLVEPHDHAEGPICSFQGI